MAEEYWKKPDLANDQELIIESKVGFWSRYFAFRAVVWIVLILAVIVLAFVAAAYLSGFASVFEMIEWYRVSFNLKFL